MWPQTNITMVCSQTLSHYFCTILLHTHFFSFLLSIYLPLPVVDVVRRCIMYSHWCKNTPLCSAPLSVYIRIFLAVMSESSYCPPHHSGLCIHAYFAVCRWPVFTWGCCHLHFLAAADIVVVVFFFFSPFSTPFKSLVVRDQKGLQQPQQHQQRKRTVYILVEHSCIINCSHD